MQQDPLNNIPLGGSSPAWQSAIQLDTFITSIRGHTENAAKEKDVKLVAIGRA